MSLFAPPPPDWPSTCFTWRIENFSRLKTKKLYSGIFDIEGSKWRLLIFPKGNNTTKHLSVCVDVPDSETLTYGWSRSAHFSLTLINHLNGDLTVRRDTQHDFNRHKSDWGYMYFIPLGELFDPCRGYLLDDTIIVETDIAVLSRDSKESGSQEESQHPSQDNNSGNVEVDTTAISGEVVSDSVWQGLVLTEAPSVDKEAERVHSESALYTSFSGTSPPQQAAQPISGTQGSSKATPVGSTSTITQAVGHASSGQASDTARGCNIGKVRVLSYWVSSEASLLLERIHGLHKDTFTKFSMKGHILQTTLFESFGSFIESMSNTKVHDEEALRLAAISIEDFEQVGLDLSWLKQRLDEAKRMNKHTESLTFVDLCESALKVARAKVRELEESLVKAKAEVEVGSRGLPKSLGVDDSVLKDVV